MTALFLTSTIDTVAKHIAQHFPFAFKNKKLAYINTAAEVETGSLSWLKSDRQALVDVGFDVSDYTLTHKTFKQLEMDLNKMDVICLSGGNTLYLLQEIYRSQFDKYIKQRLDAGVILIGASAGSIVTGNEIGLLAGIDDPSKAPDLKTTVGMKLVDLTIFPHWGNPHFKNDYLTKVVPDSYAKGQKIITLTDEQYLRAENGDYKIVDIND